MNRSPARHPGQLARVLVGAEHVDARHVQEEQDHHHRRAPLVHAAHEPAERLLIRDVADRLVGRGRVGVVAHREDHARRRLQQEDRQQRRAERLQPGRVAGHLAEQERLDQADETGALLDPLERRIDDQFLGGRACARHRLLLLALRGRRVEVREQAGDGLPGALELMPVELSSIAYSCPRIRCPLSSTVVS